MAARLRGNGDPRAPGAYDQALGARLRAARRERGLSLEALGEAIGVSYQQVQKYERGMSRMPSERLQKAATALGRSLQSLLAPEPQSGFAEAGVPFADDRPADWNVRRLAKLLDRILDERDRVAVQSVIERFSASAPRG